jgi:hypothetical protein
MFCSNVTYLKLAVFPSSGKKESFTFQLIGTSPEIMKGLLLYCTDFYLYMPIDIIVVVVLFIFAENLALKISGM